MNDEVRREASLLADILYPKRCAVCDGLSEIGPDGICRTCRAAVRPILRPKCCLCGRPVEDAGAEYCPDCSRHTHLFECGFAPFVYDGQIRESVMRFKYGHRAEYARFFAGAICRYGASFLREHDPILLVPVPVHRSRRMRRGYNQAELLADAISALTGIPVYAKGIRRVRGTMPQKELGIRQRRENLKGAFRLDGGAAIPDRVMVVDDIFTTGSTIDAVSALLLRAGARHVFFACATIAV